MSVPRSLRAVVSAAAFSLLFSAAAPARADEPTAAEEAPGDAPTSSTPLRVRAAPIFGNDAAASDGWTQIGVHIENTGSAPRKGTVEVVSRLAWSMRDGGMITRAPFHVVPGHSVVVKLSAHGFDNQPVNLSVVTKDDRGETIASTTLPQPAYGVPLLVDVHQPSRLALPLRAWPIAVQWNPTTTSYYPTPATSTLALSVGSPAFDRATGDPILPDRAAGYSAATCVLMHTDVLARLDATSLDALVNWVVTGGTLALVPARVEDLRGPVVSTLVGGPVSPAPPPAILMSLPGATKPPTGGLFPGEPSEDDPLDPATPLQFHEGTSPFVPIRTTSPRFLGRLGPSPEVKEKLSGYAGGNLTPTVYGASAAYGKGEVHLLAFDPTEMPMADDPWVHGRMVDLLAHAWDARSSEAIFHGSGQRVGGNVEMLRRSLDPNENFRPALGIAAFLLVLYSIFAGPVTFLRAAKAGKPLAPLRWVPLFSALTFGAIVLIGFAGKGWRGRARHVALVEGGAGVSRVTIRRFRGFFTSEGRALSITTTDATSVLRVAAANDYASDDASELRVDRDGMKLENIASLPWQTVVVQEDGFYDFEGGVSVLSSGDGSVDVVNHTGRTLKDVMVYVPADGVRYFDALAAGAKVHAADGMRMTDTATLLATSGSGGAAGSGKVIHSLAIEHFAHMLGTKRAVDLRETWEPIASSVGSATDWWPEVPVVMAEVEGGERVTRDAGLPLESDRLLLRVLGNGGAP